MNTQTNHQQSDHSEHEHQGGHQAHHEHMVKDFKHRFFICLVLTLPVVVLSPMLQSIFGYGGLVDFPGDMILLFALSSVIFFYGGWPFLKGLVEKKQDDEVIGGAVNGDGSLTIEVTKTGDESFLSQVVSMVQKAQESKSRSQDLANTAAMVLTFIAIGAGALTLAVWFGIVGREFVFSLERTVTNRTASGRWRIASVPCRPAPGACARSWAGKSNDQTRAGDGLVFISKSCSDEA